MKALHETTPDQTPRASEHATEGPEAPEGYESPAVISTNTLAEHEMLKLANACISFDPEGGSLG